MKDETNICKNYLYSFQQKYLQELQCKDWISKLILVRGQGMKTSYTNYKVNPNGEVNLVLKSAQHRVVELKYIY